MLNQGSLIASSSSSHRRARVALLQVRVDLGRRVALDERRVDAGVDRQLREAGELGAGLEEEDVDAGDHLGDVLLGDVRELALAELAEGHVRAVPEEQELEVVLPHQVAAAECAAVRVEHLVERGLAGVVLTSPRRARTRGDRERAEP